MFVQLFFTFFFSSYLGCGEVKEKVKVKVRMGGGCRGGKFKEMK